MMKTDAEVDKDLLVAVLKRMHSNRVQMKRAERWQGQHVRVRQVRQYGLSWENVARVVRLNNRITARSRFDDDRRELLSECRERHKLFKKEFEELTGLRDGDRVPEWIPIHKGSGEHGWSDHFRKHTDGMPVQSTLKKLLMGRAGETDFSDFQVDHKLGFENATVYYADGWFTAKLENGNDWHSPGNVRLITTSAHAAKTGKEIRLSIKRRIENGTHHLVNGRRGRTRQSFNNTKKAQELYAKGWSQAQIARYIGVSWPAVSYMLQRNLRQYAELCSVEYDESSGAN